jgi:hypothetical protein
MKKKHDPDPDPDQDPQQSGQSDLDKNQIVDQGKIPRRFSNLAETPFILKLNNFSCHGYSKNISDIPVHTSIGTVHCLSKLSLKTFPKH